jgi:hypothetical protein
MLSLNRRKVAAAAAGVLSVGVSLVGTSIPASAAVSSVDPAASQTGPSRNTDTSTVTTTCAYGLVIVLANPFNSSVLPCGTQPGWTGVPIPASPTSGGPLSYGPYGGAGQQVGGR